MMLGLLAEDSARRRVSSRQRGVPPTSAQFVRPLRRFVPGPGRPAWLPRMRDAHDPPRRGRAVPGRLGAVPGAGPAGHSRTGARRRASSLRGRAARVRRRAPSAAPGAHAVARAGQPGVVGSGFLVSDEGHLVTNYHVVSDVALQPQRHRLVYSTADGRHGALQLLAVDVVNDLALLRAADPRAVGRPRRLRFPPGGRPAGPRRAHLRARQPAGRGLRGGGGRLQRPRRAQLHAHHLLRRLAVRRHERRPRARRPGPGDGRQRGHAPRRRAGELPRARRRGAGAARARPRRRAP